MHSSSFQTQAGKMPPFCHQSAQTAGNSLHRIPWHGHDGPKMTGGDRQRMTGGDGQRMTGGDRQRMMGGDGQRAAPHHDNCLHQLESLGEDPTPPSENVVL